MDPFKDNPLGTHMSGDLHTKKYCGWDNKQQRVKGFDELKKGINDPFKHIFDDQKFCGAWFKRKDVIANKLARENGKKVARKTIIGAKIIILSCVFFSPNTSPPTSPTKYPVRFATHVILKRTKG